MMTRWLLAAAAIVLVLNGAAVENVNIRGTVSIAKLVSLPPLHLQLNNGEYNTFVRKDGSFEFRDISPGRYSVDVLSEQYSFSQYKVDISNEGFIRVIEYKYPGAGKITTEHPLEFKAHAPLYYFKQREKFGIGTILKNPSFFMLLITGAMVFIMPKMMANMDPEEMKEMQAQMNQNDPQQMLKSMFGGAAASAADEDDD